MNILFLLYMVTLILIIVLSPPRIDLSNIRPILFKNTDNVVKAIIPEFYHFTGHGIIVYFICYVRDRKMAIKSYLFALGIPVLFYFILTLICIMVMGLFPSGLSSISP